MSTAELCRLLAIDDGELAWFADMQQRNRRVATALEHYRWRTVPKRGGVRLVAAPKQRLKEIQRRLLRHLIAPIRLHEAAHGAVPGHSVRSALVPHADADVVVRMDLESFFATITAARVRGLLVAQRVEDAAIITGLCTTAVPMKVWSQLPRSADIDAHVRLGAVLRCPHLPQGAPTSPHLANAVAFGLDRRLAALAARFGARYTRYVDDLIFSGGRRLRGTSFIAAVGAVADDEGFRMAWRKTTVHPKATRQQALGAVLNVRPTLPRRERDRLRAVVHNCATHGGRSQSRGREGFRDELVGRVAAYAALDPAAGATLRRELDRVDWT